VPYNNNAQAMLISKNSLEWGFTVHTLKEFASAENSMIQLVSSN